MADKHRLTQIISFPVASELILPEIRTRQCRFPTINPGRETALPCPLYHSGAAGIDMRPIPQELFFLVGWAEEPVPSIDEKDFCKRSIKANPLLERFFVSCKPLLWREFFGFVRKEFLQYDSIVAGLFLSLIEYL